MEWNFSAVCPVNSRPWAANIAPRARTAEEARRRALAGGVHSTVGALLAAGLAALLAGRILVSGAPHPLKTALAVNLPVPHSLPLHVPLHGSGQVLTHLIPRPSLLRLHLDSVSSSSVTPLALSLARFFPSSSTLLLQAISWVACRCVGTLQPAVSRSLTSLQSQTDRRLLLLPPHSLFPLDLGRLNSPSSSSLPLI